MVYFIDWGPPLDEKTDEVVTPFVDDINDQISIYVEHLANGQLRLSDDWC
ncbi:DUF1828 domain-containing protein [Limosilactobacillus fermentum]